MKKGIFFGKKIYYRAPKYKVLSGGNWKTGWSGSKTIGGIKSYEPINLHEWWAESCQEVFFEIRDGKAFIKQLGERRDHEYAKRYCSELF